MVTDKQLETAQKELAEEDNVVNFEEVKRARLALGGKGPTDEPNWLTQLDIGTIFLVQERQAQSLPPFVLLQFAVQGVTPGGMYYLLQKPNLETTVDPFSFSRIFRLKEVLMTSEEFSYLEKLKLQDLEEQEETKE